MDTDLYDEFGNFIGEENDYSEIEEEENSLNGDDIGKMDKIIEDVDESNNELVMVDKDYIGSDVEVLVETEDRQAATEPLVKTESKYSARPQQSVFTHLKQNIPKTWYDRNYLMSLFKIPERIRNVAVVGPLHSGKTSLVDLLVIESHKKFVHSSKNTELGWKPLKYMDNLKAEIERGVSIKINGLSTLITDLKDKSAALNILDVPGHVNFFDELAVALTAVDTVIVCIDVVEGVTSITEKIIRECQRRRQKMIFVLNKIDRLILELRLRPEDTYLKLKHLVDELNYFTYDKFSPALNNVIFASAKLGFTFTIKEFVQYYYSEKISKEEILAFEEKLWGEYYFKDNNFFNFAQSSNHPTSFTTFILLPLYKIFTLTLVRDPDTIRNAICKEFNIIITDKEMNYDPQPLLKCVLSKVFRKQLGIADSIIHNRTSDDYYEKKLQSLLKVRHENTDTEILAHCLKNVDVDGSEWTLARIYKGILKVGTEVKVIDSSNVSESLNPDEDDDLDEYPTVVIKEIALISGRYLTKLEEASEKQIILLKGVSDFFTKSGTIYMGKPQASFPIFKKLNYINDSVFTVAVVPLNPQDLPKLVDGLNKINKYYPGVNIKSEESGSHIISGFGELQLDCILYDLRKIYSNAEIKASTPLTKFSECCKKESFAAIPVTSSDGKIRLTVGAQRLEPNLLNELLRRDNDNELMSDKKALSKWLREDFEWDALSSRNVWSLHNGNALVNDTLPDEVDEFLLERFKQQLCQGFYWGMREGPLTEEPILGTRFNLLKLEIDDPENSLTANQLIPLMRKACYVAILTAGPVLLEPIYEVDILVVNTLNPIVEELLERRRGGRIYGTKAIVGTPFNEIKAQIPVIESIGFETDLRLSTNGKAMCQSHFFNKIWRKIPGDVMNEDAYIPKLKPAPIQSLSRDFMMKTRRRKGISNGGFMSNDGPSLEKYIEPELFAQLKENEFI